MAESWQKMARFATRSMSNDGSASGTPKGRSLRPREPFDAMQLDEDPPDTQHAHDFTSDDASSYEPGAESSPEELEAGELSPGIQSDSDSESSEPEDLGAFDPTEHLEEIEQVILGGQSEAELEEVEHGIRDFEAQNPTQIADEDDFVDLNALHHGALHPPEFYRKAIETTVEDQYRRKEYAPGTEKLIVHAETQWRRYCEVILGKKDPTSCLRGLTFPILYQFLRWYLDQRVNKHGKRKPRVKSRQSLITFWCNFRLGVERALYTKVDKLVDMKLVQNGLAQLGKIMKLKHDKRVNRSMTINDLKRQIETTLRTTQKSFRLGELRILAVLFLLLLAPAGSRPASVLKLRFSDVNVLLVRDPNDPDGRPRLVIRLSLQFTKTYLGPKATKTFLIPEIIYDPSLLLSPHVFLLAILTRHRAFKSELLNDDLNILNTMSIYPGDNELPLAFKKDILDKFIFRRSGNTGSGLVISDAPITLGMMSDWVSSIGKLAGFEHPTISYSLRYMAGNSLDQNVNVSDALRNLVMDHAPNSDTFQKHYLNRHVCVDLMAIHRGAVPQQALIQQATSHGSSVSSRRPTELSQDQVNALKKDPKYEHLSKLLTSQPKRSAKHKELMRERTALLMRLRRYKLSEVRKEWGNDQAVEDLERHVRGQTHNAAKTTKPPQKLPPLRQRVLDALSQPVVSDYDAQIKRRNNAIQALVRYCTEEEPVMRRAVKEATQPPELSLTPSKVLEAIKGSVFAARQQDGVRRCYICVAKAEQVGQDHPQFPDLCRTFASPVNLARHFLRTHLDAMAENTSFLCPLCDVVLVHKKHLQNHSHRIHGIDTSITWPTNT